MFCYKCGNQVAEGAMFCQKCGTKVLPEDGNLHPTNTQKTSETELIPQAADVPTQTIVSKNVQNCCENDFKVFVDNHVRTTTKYQSADDLLTNSKPWAFVFPCFGILSFIGLVLGSDDGGKGVITGLLIFGVFFGYVATYITGAIIRSRYRARFYGEFNGSIDLENFRLFLNKYLRYISPLFHECGYFTQKGLVVVLDNALAKSLNEVSLCCEFGAKKKRLAIIWIRPDVRYPNSGRTQYGVHATPNGFMIDGRAVGFLGHACLIKTAPIMQAAMEYYLTKYDIKRRKDA